MGGRLCLFLSAWQSITQDPFILSVIAHGFRISVSPDFPGVLRKVTKPLRSLEAHRSVLEEISSLITKQAIVQVSDSPALSLSPIFVIPKRSGGLRVILNLKAINVFIPPQHFRMETLASILRTISPQDWAVSLDLRDAYLHVPIHPVSRRLLGFQYQNRTFQYQVLPFGLRDSPWVFTRLVAMLVGHLRCRGIRIHHYLDDWLILASSRDLLLSHLQVVLQCSQSVGFLINWEKSFLVPSQGPSYLGAVLDFPRQIARPPDRRIESLILLISRLVVSPSAPARLWQQFLGHLASLKDLVVDCLFMSRPLQIYFLRHFCPLQDSPDLLIPLTPQIKVFCLAWASREFLLPGKRFVPPPPLFTLTTDASNFGWGASLPPLHLSGQWSPQDRCLHINQQELKAVSLALQGFLPLLRGHPTLVRSDSLTVVAYINHQGGTHSVPLCLETLRLLTWCRQEGIALSASHIPGQQNLVADFLSRGKFLPSEWSLHPSVFLQIRQVHPLLAVDLFASSLAHLLPCYCARTDDPDAWALDAFSIPWSDFLGYAFPPFALLPRVLEKVASDRASLLLIAPFWPKRPWFPWLLSLLAGQPRSLPVFPGLLRQPISLTQHPNPGVLHLTLWPLSAQPGVRQAFLSGLPNSQPRISDPRREQLMIPDSNHLSSGVPLVRLTHIMPL